MGHLDPLECSTQSHTATGLSCPKLSRTDMELYFSGSLTHYLMYLFMNFRWNSLLSESLMKLASFFSGAALEQFLKTTSSSQRRFTRMSVFSAEPEYLVYKTVILRAGCHRNQNMDHEAPSRKNDLRGLSWCI